MSIAEKHSKAKIKKRRTKLNLKELISTANQVLDIILPLLNKLMIFVKILVSLILIIKQIIH